MWPTPICNFASVLALNNDFAAQHRQLVGFRGQGVEVIVGRNDVFAAQAAGESDFSISCKCVISMRDNMSAFHVSVLAAQASVESDFCISRKHVL